ncbi:MAG TPA: endonuclease MutS2 [Myxococcota bacterium]|nr:endonuclease MutS2 [Myxococcota bacterium]
MQASDSRPQAGGHPIERPPLPFTVAQKTLERLDWPLILGRLAGFARTPRGAALLSDAADASGFAATAEETRERQALTAEARAIHASGDGPPLGGTIDPAAALSRASRGGVLAGEELLGVAQTLAALRQTRRFAAQRASDAPRLADLAALLPDCGDLEREIARCLDAEGRVRDEASPALAAARREAHELAARLSDRLARILRDPDVRSALSDDYFTVRNDRYVLPVRADHRGEIRGIVHDASGTGTTLFIEPQALVELNNEHKRAELEVEREIARVLRELSEAAAAAAPEIDAGLDTLAQLDLAFARAELSIELDAAEPEIGDEGMLWLPQLRHPGLDPRRAVPNDIRLGGDLRVLVISGPNAGGKTVAMKAAALAVLFVRSGIQVPAAPGARVDLFDAVLADIGDEQSIGQSLSTFSAHMANLARIVNEASERALVVLDEVGVGTDPGEGAALAQAILEALADAGARVIATTHYGLLKEMADVDPRFANASVEFDPETLAPTYRLRVGLPGSSSATAVAARMGLASSVLERANQFLGREDRKLDRMLHELAASRAALESEQREAARLREESEAVRAEYRHKLEKLSQRRDELYRAMREDLDAQFKDAHAQIAAVIRDLQRGGPATAQEAAHARERLVSLAERRRSAEQDAGLVADPAELLAPVDWNRARAGDAVKLAGGSVGVLEALPDRRGRVAVTVGSVRMVVPAERVGSAGPGEVAAKPTGRDPRPAPAGGGTERCDLRGQRVDEALDALGAALDRAASGGRDRLLVIHGLGTGALRKAVREHLAASPYVARLESAEPGEGGDGASIAYLH